MLPLHTKILAGRLRRFTWSSFFCWALFVCASCSSSPEGQGAFYSYVDGQGNTVTVSRDTSPPGKPNKQNLSTSDHKATTVAGPNQSDAEANPALNRYASNPNELWALDDEGYITSDDFESEATRKLKERFISYPDETGRLVARQVDMAAAKQAVGVRKELALDTGEKVVPEVREVTRWTSIRTDCCREILDASLVVLTDGDEKPVNVMARPRGSIVIDQQHPATAFSLDSSLKQLQLQSWDKKGYLYPQALFLDKDGIPLARVSQIFTRAKEQTWAAQPYLIGEIPIEPSAVWVVFFLEYAHIDQKGGVSQSKDYLKFNGADLPLALRAELVIRATNGEF